MSAHVVIPARYGSTRLPGKPLAEIGGQPMIVRVAEQVSRASVDGVHVAVDDERVFKVVAEAGYSAVMTREDHPSGSDRVMEVASQLALAEEDIVINVQGDEPLMPPAVIEQLVAEMSSGARVDIATLCEPVVSKDEFFDPNVVKVVQDSQGFARYFSRAPIPYPRDREAVLDEAELLALKARRHIGIYGFKVRALREFVALRDSHLEATEKLEQLRWLEAGRNLLVLDSIEPVPGGIDTPEDLERVNAQVALG